MNMRKRIRATVGGRSPAGSWRARSAGLLVALAALALGVAGCGGSSGGSGSAPAASGGGGSDSDSDKLVQYAQCMRKNGVPGFPDPVNGEFNLQVTPGGALDPTSPQWKAAQQACKSLEPPGLQSGSAQSNQQQSQALKFAACMRKNGVPDFPDPQTQGGGFIVGEGVDSNSPQFQSALTACRKLQPGGATTGGG
jgi:hypothetical protein